MARWQNIGLGALAVATIATSAAALSRPAAQDTGYRPPPVVTPSPRATPSPATYATVLFAGDSLSQGSYASSRDRAYTSLTSAAVGAKVATVVGRSGMTTVEAIKATAAKPVKADLTVVEFGTNDAAQNGLEPFRAAYPAYIEAVRKAAPDARLVCLGAWIGGEAGQFDDIIEGTCRANGGTYVDLTGAYTKEANRAQRGDAWYGGSAPDGFHPNDAGHAEIAARITDALAG